MPQPPSPFCPLLPPLFTPSQPKPCSPTQVDSLSVAPGPLGTPELMVSQPGCAYAILRCTWTQDAGHPPIPEGTAEGSR